MFGLINEILLGVSRKALPSHERSISKIWKNAHIIIWALIRAYLLVGGLELRSRRGGQYSGRLGDT